MDGVEINVRFAKPARLKAILLVLMLTIGLSVAAPLTARAATPATWSANPSTDETATWRSVTYSPQLKLFVSIGTAGLMTSPDGINWTAQTVPSATWRDVTWSPDLGIFVVVGTNGANSALTSPDGITWTPQALSSNSWSAVTWGNGKFVAGGLAFGSSATSSDGITWAVQSNPPDPTLASGIVWSAADSQYVMSSSLSQTLDPGEVYTSPDGITWTSQAMPEKSWADIAYSPQLGLYVTVGANGIATSSDGRSDDGTPWVMQTSPMLSLTAVTWSAENGEFLAVNATGGIITSPDGITWTPVTPPAANRWEDVVWSPELFRYVGVGSTGTNRTMVGIVPTVPSAPLNLAAVLNGNKVDLSWNTPSFDGNSVITGYRIERSVNGGPFEVLVANTGSPATTYADTAIVAGTSYAYRVYALNAQGQSIASNTVTIQTGATLPGEMGSSLAETGVSQYGIIAGASLLLIGGVGLLTPRFIKRKVS